jgi:ribosomal protein L4
VKVLLVGGLNVYDMLKHHTLILTREALDQVVGRLGETA